MNEDTVEALESVIDGRGSDGRYTDEDLPEPLAGTEFVTASEELPNRCQRDGCRISCQVVERNGGEIRMECRREEYSHTFTINSSEYTFYDIEFESLLQIVADHIGETISSVAFDLPRRVTAITDSGLRLTMPVAPARFEREVMEIYAEALRDDQPTLLLTTEGKLEDLLELASLFSTGSLVYATPLSAIAETSGHLSTMTETAQAIQTMEQEFVDERYDEIGDLIHRVNMNPRYILTELNHMRLLRKTGHLSGGDRLETVAELVFSHLFSTYPGEGGEDDSGQSVPDNLFHVPALDLSKYSKSILGVVDAKSADRAKFGREEARGKHDEYLERAERESINTDQVAHAFIILEFKGQQEIEFFDKMDEFYDEDTHLLIFTADALAMLMAAYLAATVANELELIRGDFRAAIYPLFEPTAFRDAGLARIEREVGQLQEDYRDRYLQRSDLLIIHRSVVKKQLQRCLASEKEIEPIFERYFAEMPLI